MVFYVIVRGPLGSGKTALSRRVAGAIGGKYIAIDRILEEHDLEQWEDDYISEPSFLAANGIAVREAEASLRQGTPVVIDGNFYWKSVVEDLVARLPHPHVVFTLKVPLSVCVARDAGRPVPLGAENTKMVFDKTTTFDYGVALDATGSLAETTRLLLEGLRRAKMPGV